MGPADLEQVLLPLKKYNSPNLIVGLEVSDDAAVYQLGPDQAMVQTVDFFPPVVDDPYMYGAIAAANSMSDVYAMGGEVIMGINIVGFPDNLPYSILSKILQGGADKMAEVGAVVAGGHTVTDKEPKYGLCVTGLIHPQKVLTKGGAKAGDILYLTKPLGIGIITTAGKRDVVDADTLNTAIASMARLNRGAAQAIKKVGVEAVHCCTDVTGFGILGHGSEMVRQSVEVDFVLETSLIPFLPGARKYAQMGTLPGGVARNRAFLQKEGAPKVRFLNQIETDLDDLLFDPETSGGLFFAVDPTRTAEIEQAFAEADEPLWRIGEVRPGSGLILVN
jgi:selenide,water dikinase